MKLGNGKMALGSSADLCCSSHGFFFINSLPLCQVLLEADVHHLSKLFFRFSCFHVSMRVCERTLQPSCSPTCELKVLRSDVV